MNNKSKRYKFYGILTFLITGLAMVLSFSGCLGTESRTNISIGSPEAVEALGGRVETLSIELVPQDADAKNVIVNLTAPPGISLTDLHTSFQQYSKEFKKIQKGKKEVILFNYSTAFVDDEYDLILEAKADNANVTKRTIRVNLSIPVPKWEVGEYWVLNQTLGDSSGTHVRQVLRNEIDNGKEVYVVKDTLAREETGNYRLYYYTVEDLAHVKTEYYEDDKIIERMTETIDSPSSMYGLPFKVRKTWTWNGTASGIGRTEIKGEVLKKERISVQGRNFDAYKIRLKYVYPLGTGVWEVWYSPDTKEIITEKGSMSMGGSVKESNIVLVKHGLPPDLPPSIHTVPQVPQGWKTYVDTDKHFSFSYPGDWNINKSLEPSVIIEDKRTGAGVLITVEPVTGVTLEDYSKKAKNKLANLGEIVKENYTEINGRIGYKFTIFYTYMWGELKTVVFVANGNGYTIFIPPVNIDPSIFEGIINSFVIKEPTVYTLLERK